MTPTPPSSSGDFSLPPRQRPQLNDLAKNSTESDLWALDDEDGQQPAKLPIEPRDGSSLAAGELPVPRESQRAIVRGAASDLPASAEPAAPSEERIQMNVSKWGTASRSPSSGTVPAPAESEFEELETWMEKVAPSDAPAAPLEAVAPQEARPAVPVPAAEPAAADVAAEPTADRPVAAPAAPTPDGGDVAPSVRQGWSTFERISLLAFLVVLLAGGAVVGWMIFSRLPTTSAGRNAIQFPIKGSHITVQSATSYWRAPITGGPETEVTRRGTALLPVLELNVSGGSGVVRVLFRNDQRAVVGDAVMRKVEGQGTLQIPATAGFGDTGMFAAYRTGDDKPWTIEVYEAPSATAAAADIKLLFEQPISTDRR